MMTNKQYMEHKGMVCPMCSSRQVAINGELEVDGDTAWQAVTCTKCNYEWNDVWSLVGFEQPESEPQTVSLFKLIESADTMICQGYEIDSRGMVFYESATGGPELQDVLRLDHWDDTIALVRDQQVGLNSDGEATAVSVDNDALKFQFKATRPLTLGDLE